jgi:hypothetical protein
MSLYKKILSQAWKITWHYKYLWFFGLFAVLLGSGGEYEILFRSLSGEGSQAVFPGWQRIAETGLFSSQTPANIGQIMKEDPLSLLIVLIVFLIILVLFGFLIWLSVISQAALVNNTAGYLAGKKVDFKSGIAKASEKFWPVFSLNIIIKLLIYLAFILVSLPVILTVGKPEFLTVNLLYIIAFIIFVPIALALSLMVKYAIAYIVIKSNSFIESIKAGWQLFIKNWLVSIEMAFILFFINLFAGLLIILVVLTLTIPFLFLALAVYKLTTLAGFWLIAILALITLLAIIILGGAILSSFQISTWTGLFVQLVSKGGTSKIIRVVEGIRGKIVK